ncbi:hypothetical protein [Flavihumibacter solisilvae]|uniref:Uncharacterized protein n=1 Tax=Flavihumibacter solisilvae TaxID=1349421 RepID=A0A0C1LCL5_9BACT|nr:hypothetical protein [Flavihumibacter solisilvae]KIC93253.1 hypothetical protein OI18_18550 [Flavihumibacter solisilvae]
MSLNTYQPPHLGSGNDKPSRKKPMFPVIERLRAFLKHHGREVRLPVAYRDLQRFTYSLPVKDKEGKDTMWETVVYDMREWDYIREGLIRIYAILKTEGDMSFSKHLDVARIDFCAFGNSQPFRIRIVNKFNDNYDHYYIKIADASRIYGLELEHLLSPNRITFFTSRNTLVEEHIPGIPGDIFIQSYLDNSDTNKIRFAKEFVKFNERCFVRLLGDMRSYNFVVDITPDIEDFQYRIRAIDFDQQSYEGRKNLYLPQFFKENNPFVQTTLKYLNSDSIAQYQTEERTMMAFRLVSARYRIKELLDTMGRDQISTPEKIHQLAGELAEFHGNVALGKTHTMGKLVKQHLKVCLRKNLLMIPRFQGRFED